MNTAERLRSLREKAGLSQKEMANKLKIGRTTYVKYETGDSKPVRKLTEIAAIFNVSVDYLLCKDANQEISNLKNEDLYTREEREIIKKYRQLDADGKNLIKVMINTRLQQLLKTSDTKAI